MQIPDLGRMACGASTPDGTQGPPPRQSDCLFQNLPPETLLMIRLYASFDPASIRKRKPDLKGSRTLPLPDLQPHLYDSLEFTAQKAARYRHRQPDLMALAWSAAWSQPGLRRVTHESPFGGKYLKRRRRLAVSTVATAPRGLLPVPAPGAIRKLGARCLA